MPFTPIHFGFSVFIFSILPFMDLVALLIGAVIMDLEPIFYLITGIGQLHGILHSILGVLVFFIPTTFISWLCYRFLKLDKYLPSFNIYISLLSGIFGLFSHIFFDAIMYSEIMFFYPFSKRSGILFNLVSSRTDYLILIIMFIVGIIIIGLRCFVKYKKRKISDKNQTLSEGR